MAAHSPTRVTLAELVATLPRRPDYPPSTPPTPVPGLYQDAQTTTLLLQNLGRVITALQPTKDAVVRVGALLIVKVDWQVQVT